MCAEQKAQKTAARLGGSLKILKENQRLLNSKSPKYTMLNVRRFLRFLLDFQRKSAVFRCIQL